MALIIAPVNAPSRKFRRELDRENPVARIFHGAVANSNLNFASAAALTTLTAPSVLLSPEDLDILTEAAAGIRPAYSDLHYMDQGAYDGQFPSPFGNPHVPGGIIDKNS